MRFLLVCLIFGFLVGGSLLLTCSYLSTHDDVRIESPL